MTRTLLVLVLALGAAAAARSPAAAQAIVGSAYIVPEAEGARFYAAHGTGVEAEGYWAPSADEARSLVRALRSFLATPEARRQITMPFDAYRFHLIGVIRPGGARAVFISAFCRSGTAWTHRAVSVDDGGDCYFEVEYELASRAFVRLSPHGDG